MLEGFVLDFCPTFRILSFVMSGKNLRSPFTKQLTGLFCSLRSNLSLRRSKKEEPPDWVVLERGIRSRLRARSGSALIATGNHSLPTRSNPFQI